MTLRAGKYELYIQQGADYSQVFTWKQGTPSLPVNLTGYSARAKVKKTYQDEDSLIELNTENGGIVLGGALGTITIIMTNEQTESLDFSTGVWDLELESASGFVTRLLQGPAVLSQEVTTPDA